jgi:hypothetical protein
MSYLVNTGFIVALRVPATEIARDAFNDRGDLHINHEGTLAYQYSDCDLLGSEEEIDEWMETLAPSYIAFDKMPQATEWSALKLALQEAGLSPVSKTARCFREFEYDTVDAPAYALSVKEFLAVTGQMM